LIIESEKDDSVPHQTILNYVNAVKDKSKLTHILMKGAPHSIKEGKFRDEVERILVDWFKKIN
jgi:esterase/lipase